MKKLASLAAAGALLLGMAAPVFGCWWCGGGDDVTINNHAWVSSRVRTHANTGRNSTKFGGSIGTGPAAATAVVVNDTNYNEVGCDCADDVTINNHAWVSSRVKTRANTGRNSTTFCGSIGTGAANASSIVTNLVNTSIVNGL